MKLAIADPPYPPATRLRTDGRPGRGVRVVSRSRSTRWYSGHADDHPDAAMWDLDATHTGLLAQLEREFDGWVIATSADGLAAYGQLPPGVRIMFWHITNACPTSARVSSTVELVIVRTPVGRLGPGQLGPVPDLLSAAAPRAGFAGAKPPAWTRWVLDAMGYEPDADELVDVFPGSGAVSAAAAQLALL